MRGKGYRGKNTADGHIIKLEGTLFQKHKLWGEGEVLGRSTKKCLVSERGEELNGKQQQRRIDRLEH